MKSEEETSRSGSDSCAGTVRPVGNLCPDQRWWNRLNPQPQSLLHARTHRFLLLHQNNTDDSDLIHQIKTSIVSTKRRSFSDFFIHNIDECCWMKDAWPVKAQAQEGATTGVIKSTKFRQLRGIYLPGRNQNVSPRSERPAAIRILEQRPRNERLRSDFRAGGHRSQARIHKAKLDSDLAWMFGQRDGGRP